MGSITLLILLGLLGMISASEDEQCCNLIPNKLWHVTKKQCIPGCNKYSFDKNKCLGTTARANRLGVGQGSVMRSMDWAPGCTSAGVWMYFNQETKAKKIQGVTKLYCEQPYTEINMKCASNELYHVNQKKCVPGCNEYEFNEAVCRARAPTRWGRGSRTNTRCNWAPGCTSAGVWTYFNANRQATFIQGVTKLYCKKPYSKLYHLAPEGSNACNYGVSASQSDCEAAAISLSPNPRRRMVTGTGGTCLDGGWGQVPLGCSAQTGGDKTAHYKTSGDTGAGCIHQAYQLVCTEG